MQVTPAYGAPKASRLMRLLHAAAAAGLASLLDSDSDIFYDVEAEARDQPKTFCRNPSFATNTKPRAPITLAGVARTLAGTIYLGNRTLMKPITGTPETLMTTKHTIFIQA